jgi:hypothetical protein
MAWTDAISGNEIGGSRQVKRQRFLMLLLKRMVALLRNIFQREEKTRYHLTYIKNLFSWFYSTAFLLVHSYIHSGGRCGDRGFNREVRVTCLRVGESADSGLGYKVCTMKVGFNSVINYSPKVSVLYCAVH